MAEYFRDEEGRDVLLFIDNIFRFTQAGSEVSALLGRMPSAVGYQPNLATEMAGAPGADHLHEEGLDHVAPGGLRPRGRLHRPGAGDAFGHLDSTIRLERYLTELGIYPAVDPLSSTSRILDPLVVGQEHYDVAREVQRVLQQLPRPAGHHRDPRHRRAGRGGQGHGRPRAPAAALHEPADVRRGGLHGPCRQVRADPGQVASFKEILEGKADDLPEQAFFLAGTIDDVRANAEKLAMK